MDIAVLLLSMFFFFAIGMPIAYALALSSLVGALWIDLPVGAVMQQFASGVGKVSMLTIPFFVLAGAIMAEGGMAKRLVILQPWSSGSHACGAASRRSTFSRPRS